MSGLGEETAAEVGVGSKLGLPVLLDLVKAPQLKLLGLKLHLREVRNQLLRLSLVEPNIFENRRGFRQRGFIDLDAFRHRKSLIRLRRFGLVGVGLAVRLLGSTIVVIG